MLSILKSIPDYNILTNLIPGAVLCFLANWFCGIDVMSLVDNEWFLLIVFYFFGVVNNRIGSLVFESVRYVHNCTKHDYPEFLKAEKADDSVQSNKLKSLERMAVEYRSYTAIFFNLIILKIYSLLPTNLYISASKEWIPVIVGLLLFVFALRKQTKYVSKRIESLNRMEQNRT